MGGAGRMALGLVSCIIRGSAALAVAPPAALGIRRCTTSSTTLGRTAIDIARIRRAELSMAQQPTNHSSLSEFPDFGGAGKLIKMAFKASQMVKPNPKITNSKKQAQSHAAARIDAYTSTITKALKEKQRTFHDMKRRLRPFEGEMATLSQLALERSGGRSLKRVMDDFDLMRRAVVRSGKEASAAAANAEHKREAQDLAESGIEAVRATLEREDEAMRELGRTVTALRRLPRVEQGEPVLVLVGMPNVGKSSLVTATSTGTPEINMYPFTTRSLKMGHVITPGHRYQLMDTPGVLRREEDERNAMEGLTLASVSLLPSVVVFVMDLSGMSGQQSSPQLQLRVREELRSQFPDRPWLDMRSKADLPFADEVDQSMVPPGTLEVSVLDGTNIDELKERMTAFAVDEGTLLANQALAEQAEQAQLAAAATLAAATSGES